MAPEGRSETIFPARPGGCPAVWVRGSPGLRNVLRSAARSGYYYPYAPCISIYRFTMIYLHDWVIFRATVSKYSIHGAYGLVTESG